MTHSSKSRFCLIALLAVDAERWKKNYELAKRRDSKQQ